MARKDTVAFVDDLPDCDFCKELVDHVVANRQAQDVIVSRARYDFKTKRGPWAYGCEFHWKAHRLYRELGMGKGQALRRRTETVKVGAALADPALDSDPAGQS